MAIQRIVSGLARMTSPLKENSSTSVSSRAMMVTGVSRCRNFSSNHASPLAAMIQRRDSVAGHQRQGHVDADRQQQRLPRHRQPAHAQQEAAQHAVEHQHGQRVDGHHDQRVPVVAPGQVAPDQHHGRAGRDAQQDAAGQVAAPQRHLQHLHALVQDHGPGAVDRAHRQVQAQRQLHQVHRLRPDEPPEQHAQEQQAMAYMVKGLIAQFTHEGQAHRLDAAGRP